MGATSRRVYGGTTALIVAVGILWWWRGSLVGFSDQTAALPDGGRKETSSFDSRRDDPKAASKNRHSASKEARNTSTQRGDEPIGQLLRSGGLPTDVVASPERFGVLSVAMKDVLRYRGKDQEAITTFEATGDARAAVRGRYTVDGKFDPEYALTDILALLRRKENGLDAEGLTDRQLRAFASAVAEELLDVTPGDPAAALLQVRAAVLGRDLDQAMSRFEDVCGRLGGDKRAWLADLCDTARVIAEMPGQSSDARAAMERVILMDAGLEGDEAGTVARQLQAAPGKLDRWENRLQKDPMSFKKTNECFISSDMYPPEIIEGGRPRLYTESEEFLKLWQSVYRMQAMNTEGNARGLLINAAELADRPHTPVEAQVATMSKGLACLRSGRLSAGVKQLETALESPLVTEVPSGAVAECRLELAMAYYRAGQSEKAAKVLSDNEVLGDSPAGYFPDGADAINEMLAVIQTYR